MKSKMKTLKLAAFLGAITVATAGFGFANIAPVANFATGNAVVATAATQDVVSVNGVGYTTLQEAVDAAQDGAVVEFLTNVTGNVVITQKANVNVVIDGKGNDFTGVMTVYGDAGHDRLETLTIKNINFYAVVGTTSCIVSPDRSVYNRYSYSHNVTVENCNFYGEANTATRGEVAAIRHEDGGDVNWTIENCLVDENMHSLVQTNNVEGKLIIKGCTVNSKNGLNLNQCTNVEIIDCNMNTTGYCIRAGASSGSVSADERIVLENNVLKSECDGGDAVVMFRGTSSNASLDMSENIVSGTTHISGTTADTTVSANGNYWDGKEAPVVSGTAVDVDYSYTALNPNGSLNTNPLVKIGDVEYYSLKAAYDAAVDGDTIKLLNDMTGTGIKIQKSVTIDFGGFTYTVNSGVGSRNTETNAFQILASTQRDANNNRIPYDVTFKNGAIAVVEDPVAGSKEIKTVIMNYCNLTLEDMIIDGTGNTEMMYGVVFNNGLSNVKGNTSIKVNPGVTAVDIDGSQSSYGAVNVTIDTEGKINGKVDIYGEESSVGIEKGTFEDNMNVYQNAKVGITEATVNGDMSISDNALAAILDGAFTGQFSVNESALYIYGGSYTSYTVLDYLANDDVTVKVNGQSFGGDNNQQGGGNQGGDSSEQPGPNEPERPDGLTDEQWMAILGVLGALNNSQNNGAQTNDSEVAAPANNTAAVVIAIVASSLVVLIVAAAVVLWILEKKEIFKISKYFKD